MVPDIERIIESIARRDQDSVQLLLNSYNTQVTILCYNYCVAIEVFIYATMETVFLYIRHCKLKILNITYHHIIITALQQKNQVSSYLKSDFALIY